MAIDVKSIIKKSLIKVHRKSFPVRLFARVNSDVCGELKVEKFEVCKNQKTLRAMPLRLRRAL